MGDGSRRVRLSKVARLNAVSAVDRLMVSPRLLFAASHEQTVSLVSPRLVHRALAEHVGSWRFYLFRGSGEQADVH
jgi:hypothetical protein